MPTVTVNEDWSFGLDDENFLVFSGTFFRLGVGYQLGNRFLLSLNAGCDYHFPYNIHAFPTYAKLRYNIWTDTEQAFFFQFSRGKMWRSSGRYSDGKYFSAGSGYELESESKWKSTITFTYHRKQINGLKDLNTLKSISIGVGFRFF